MWWANMTLSSCSPASRWRRHVLLLAVCLLNQVSKTICYGRELRLAAVVAWLISHRISVFPATLRLLPYALSFWPQNTPIILHTPAAVLVHLIRHLCYRQMRASSHKNHNPTVVVSTPSALVIAKRLVSRDNNIWRSTTVTTCVSYCYPEPLWYTVFNFDLVKYFQIITF